MFLLNRYTNLQAHFGGPFSFTQGEFVMKYIVRVLFVLLILFTATSVFATPASPTGTQACWSAPTTFTNNVAAASTDIIGYFVYYAPAGSTYSDTDRITFPDNTVTCVQASQFPTGLSDGAYTMAVTANGTAGESAYSDNLSFTVTGGVIAIQKKLLNAPSGFITR